MYFGDVERFLEFFEEKYTNNEVDLCFGDREVE